MVCRIALVMNTSVGLAASFFRADLCSRNRGGLLCGMCCPERSSAIVVIVVVVVLVAAASVTLVTVGGPL